MPPLYGTDGTHYLLPLVPGHPKHNLVNPIAYKGPTRASWERRLRARRLNHVVPLVSSDAAMRNESESSKVDPRVSFDDSMRGTAILDFCTWSALEK